MIRRYPQRPSRRPYQDFHFFAAGDPTANIEAQFARPPQPTQPPAEPSQPAAAMDAQESPALAVEPTATTVASSEPPAAPASQPAHAGATAGPPFRIAIPVLPEHAHGLDRAPLMRPSDEKADEEEDGTEDCDDESALERTLRSVDKIRKGQSLFRPERPAIEELQALERKHKRRQAARGSKSTARLATPRSNRSNPARQLPQPSDGLSDHELRCTICPHPYRAEIENEFMHWHTIRHIAYDYQVSRSAIYRHAHALGLFSRRNRNLRFSLGHLIEHVQDVEPTADSIVRAVHAFARINDDGQWVEPPAHVVVSSGGIRRESAAPSGRSPIVIPLDSEAISNVIDVNPDSALPPVAPGTVNRVNADATR